MKDEVFGSVTTEDGEFIKVVSTDGNDITHLFRDDMIKIAYKEGQGLKYNSTTGRSKRIDLDEVPAPAPPKQKKEIVETNQIDALNDKAKEEEAVKQKKKIRLLKVAKKIHLPLV